jgi:hypothetical protein
MDLRVPSVSSKRAHTGRPIEAASSSRLAEVLSNESKEAIIKQMERLETEHEATISLIASKADRVPSTPESPTDSLEIDEGCWDNNLN